MSKQQNKFLSEARQKADDILREAFVKEFRGDYSPMSLEVIAGVRVVRHIHDGDRLTDMLRNGKLRLTHAWVLYFYYLMYWSHKNKYLWREVLQCPTCIGKELPEHRWVHVKAEGEIKNLEAKMIDPAWDWDVMLEPMRDGTKQELALQCGRFAKRILESFEPRWIYVAKEACRFTNADNLKYWKGKEKDHSSPAQRRKRVFMARDPIV